MNVKRAIAIIIGIVGLIWFLREVWVLWKVKKIQSWPRVNAVVLMSGTSMEGDGNIFEDIRDIFSGKDNFVPHIKYKYTVHGIEHISSNITYGGDNKYNKDQIEKFLTVFPKGKEIPVLYNPNDPSESYIFVGDHKYYGLIGSIILLIIAFALGAVSGNGNNKSKSATNKSNSMINQIDQMTKSRTSYMHDVMNFI